MVATLPFTAVKNLYLYKEFAPGIAAALQELDEGRDSRSVAQPAEYFRGGSERSGPSFPGKSGQFVAARQLSNHTITISERDGRRMR
jgi:hypothetical protein